MLRIRQEFPAHFPLFWKRPVHNPVILDPEPTMKVELHQLDQGWEHLRSRPAAQQRRLIASLVEGRQQTPIIVVWSRGTEERYVVIGGHKRIRALRQLGRDIVEDRLGHECCCSAVAGPDHALQCAGQRIEQGWLLSEMERRFDYWLDELARRFDRGVSWVAKRVALVELLPNPLSS